MDTGYNFGDTQCNMDLGETIKAARQAKGLSQQALGKAVGISQPAVKKIEAGTTKNPRKILEIAKVLDIPLSKIAPDLEAAGLANLTMIKENVPTERNFPVYASAEGGRGSMVLSSDPVEYIARPDAMARISDGYGIIVVSTSMVPEFKPGDVAHVHKVLPPIAGEACVLYSDDGNGAVLVTIKSFIKATAADWHVEQWNPKRKFTLSRKDWQTCHRVVGKTGRR